MAHAKGQVVITAAQRAVLERLVRAYTTPQHIAQRARIVLLSSEGMRNVDQAAVLGTDPQRVRRWRRRWADAQPALAAAEVTEGEHAYVEDLIIDLLQDQRDAGEAVPVDVHGPRAGCLRDDRDDDSLSAGSALSGTPGQAWLISSTVRC